MVTLFVGGKKIGFLADADKLLASSRVPIELRDESDEVLGTFFPTMKPEPGQPLLPWDPSITEADIERIQTEPGFTFEEVRKQLGWA